ncbi:MAG: hypothetical protein ACPGLV_19110, partial [Bacteroidia bacterium]
VGSPTGGGPGGTGIAVGPPNPQLNWMPTGYGHPDGFIAGGGSGGGSGIKMKDIGKTKNPKKVGAICRDGSSDYKVGPNTCAKGNGVKMWIYSAPK